MVSQHQLRITALKLTEAHLSLEQKNVHLESSTCLENNMQTADSKPICEGSLMLNVKGWAQLLSIDCVTLKEQKGLLVPRPKYGEYMQNCVNTMDSEEVQLTLTLLSDTAILCLQYPNLTVHKVMLAVQ